MSLQFILGNSGSGKSRYAYEKIIGESTKNPEENFLVIVPEQFTMQTQKELVSLHPKKGILNIDVQSFQRLAYHVFEEVGRTGVPCWRRQEKIFCCVRLPSSSRTGSGF